MEFPSHENLQQLNICFLSFLGMKIEILDYILEWKF